METLTSENRQLLELIKEMLPEFLEQLEDEVEIDDQLTTEEK